MSIRWRIMGAFLLVIFSTVIIGTGFDYWTASKDLSDFSAKIRTEDMADVISRQYTSDGRLGEPGWHTEFVYGVLLDDRKSARCRG